MHIKMNRLLFDKCSDNNLLNRPAAYSLESNIGVSNVKFAVDTYITGQFVTNGMTRLMVLHEV